MAILKTMGVVEGGCDAPARNSFMRSAVSGVGVALKDAV